MEFLISLVEVSGRSLILGPIPTFSLKDQGQTLFFSWDSRFWFEYGPFWSLSDKRKPKRKSVNRKSKIIFIRTYTRLGYAGFVKFLASC